jgi:polar amino acid transport system substrate-binding protein
MNIRPSTVPLGLGLVAALSLTLAACGAGEVEKAGQTTPADAGQSSDQTSQVQTVEAGKLKVCTNPPYAPFEDTNGTEVVGFDMDLTAEVAKDLGLEVEFVTTGFESIESGASLDTGSCDIGASALSITEDRLAKLDFSEPYYETTMGVLVAADSGIATLADLTDKPVGVQQGTTGEDWANEQPELTELRQYEGLGDQTTALKAGDVVAVINDVPTLTPYEDEGFKVIAGLDEGGDRLGFAIKKGNTALLDQINKTLERVRSDGTYDALVAKWFAG